MIDPTVKFKKVVFTDKVDCIANDIVDTFIPGLIPLGKAVETIHAIIILELINNEFDISKNKTAGKIRKTQISENIENNYISYYMEKGTRVAKYITKKDLTGLANTLLKNFITNHAVKVKTIDIPPSENIVSFNSWGKSKDDILDIIYDLIKEPIGVYPMDAGSPETYINIKKEIDDYLECCGMWDKKSEQSIYRHTDQWEIIKGLINYLGPFDDDDME